MLLRYITRFANVVALLVVFQALFFAALIYRLQSLYFPAAVALIAVSVVAALFIASGESHPVFRLAWVTAIMMMPVFGGVVYVYYHRRKIDRLVERSHAVCLSRAQSAEIPGSGVPPIADPASAKISAYLHNTVGFAPAAATAAFFPVGEEKIARLLAELKKAERYIFLEYFIIEEGVVWDSIRAILAEKSAAGVDVRLICDGAGCMYPLPWRFAKEMKKLGIQVRMFNPVRPVVSARINARNHRKIASIDGKVAFCGGLNLADQYANIKEMFGHWKDSAVIVDGATAWNLTLLFLSMWEFIGKGKDHIDYAAFRPDCANTNPASNASANTIAIPLLDIPKDRVTVSEHTFINFISRAEKYVYITTPYLMCGGEILSAMYAAARSGTDVRIITPYIADKRMVKLVTESYYRLLIANKVRVFEYLPGFIHAKNILADGKRAMVGTVNLDYRSLYLHYECGVCLFGGDAVEEITRDFDNTFAQCKEITEHELMKVSLFKRGLQRFCRLFAPFL